MQQKSGYIIISSVIIVMLTIYTIFSLFRLVEVINGIKRPGMSNDVQHWLLLFLVDLMFLIGSICALFLLGNKIFSSDLIEKPDKLRKIFKFTALLGAIIAPISLLISMFLILTVPKGNVGEFINLNTPLGLFLNVLTRIGVLMLMIGLPMLTIDYLERRKPIKSKEK